MIDTPDLSKLLNPAFWIHDILGAWHYSFEPHLESAAAELAHLVESREGWRRTALEAYAHALIHSAEIDELKLKLEHLNKAHDEIVSGYEAVIARLRKELDLI